MSSRIGLVGLGNMGSAMAERLSACGIQVLGTDVSERARALAAPFCRVVSKPEELAADADVVLLSLPSSQEVEQILSGPSGALRLFKRPTLFIDTSTSDPRSTRRLAVEAAEHGHCLVDAPVSGGPAGAKSGALSIALAGPASGKQSAMQVLAPLAKRIVDVGDTGAGHMVKLANNFLVATNLIVLADLCRLIDAFGYDAGAAVSMINTASGRSGVTDVNYPKWIATRAFDSGFTVGLMNKDVSLTSAVAEGMESVTPVLRAIADRWAQECKKLGAGSDFNQVAA